MKRRRAAADLFPVNVWPPFVDAVLLTLAAFVLLTLLAFVAQQSLLKRLHEGDRELRSLRADKERVERRLRALAPSGTIEVDEGKVILQGEVLFDSGSDKLRVGGRSFLERLAPNLRGAAAEPRPAQICCSSAVHGRSRAAQRRALRLRTGSSRRRARSRRGARPHERRRSPWRGSSPPASAPSTRASRTPTRARAGRTAASRSCWSPFGRWPRGDHGRRARRLGAPRRAPPAPGRPRAGRRARRGEALRAAARRRCGPSRTSRRPRATSRRRAPSRSRSDDTR